MSARRGYDVFLQGEYAGTVWGTRAEAQQFIGNVIREELIGVAFRTMFARRRVQSSSSSRVCNS
jgi:hypothetical protein